MPKDRALAIAALLKQGVHPDHAKKLKSVLSYRSTSGRLSWFLLPGTDGSNGGDEYWDVAISRDEDGTSVNVDKDVPVAAEQFRRIREGKRPSRLRQLLG